MKRLTEPVLSDEAFRELAGQGLREHMATEHDGQQDEATVVTPARWAAFAQNLFYQMAAIGAMSNRNRTWKEIAHDTLRCTL